MQFFGGHVGKESGSTISHLEMYALLLVQIVVLLFFSGEKVVCFTTYAFFCPAIIERASI